jgi:diguanylate cyclase (GGDEF)-like protein
LSIYRKLRREGLIRYIESFSFPVVVVASDYSIVLMNRSASERFPKTEGRCYEVTHNIDRPCWEVFGEDSCPVKRLQRSEAPYAFHEHRGTEDTHVIAAGKLEEDLYIEFYIDSYITDMIREFKFLAETDPLTGVYNRRKIEEVLRSEMERSLRYGSPLSLIFLDLDNFKRINDTYGHRRGDEILKAVARTVMEAVRRTDWVGRYGGEEFLVLLPQTTREGARRVGERIRRAVKDLRLGVTVSLGVTSFRPHDTLDTILERVDRAVYRAKKKGGDRIEEA